MTISEKQSAILENPNVLADENTERDKSVCRDMKKDAEPRSPIPPAELLFYVPGFNASETEVCPPDPSATHKDGVGTKEPTFLTTKEFPVTKDKTWQELGG